MAGKPGHRPARAADSLGGKPDARLRHVAYGGDIWIASNAAGTLTHID